MPPLKIKLVKLGAILRWQHLVGGREPDLARKTGAGPADGSGQTGRAAGRTFAFAAKEDASIRVSCDGIDRREDSPPRITPIALALVIAAPGHEGTAREGGQNSVRTNAHDVVVGISGSEIERVVTVHQHG